MSHSKRPHFLAPLACAVIALGISAPRAQANIPVQPQVTGQVSSMNGTAAVTINGQTYLIDSSSPAYKQVQSVHVGDQIGLVLSGPAGSASSQVINIVTNGSTTTSPASP